ncbi:MAG: hypothetical protein U0V64_03340 [Cyclobacteriaceae bacterium]
MHPDARDGRDAFDGFVPPRFFDYAEVYTNHPETIAGQDLPVMW